MSNRGLSEYETNFMLGYVDQDTLAYAVLNEEVHADGMIHHVQEMNRMWGGYDGLLTFFRLCKESPTLARRFLKDYREIGQNKSVHIHDFDEDYTEEQWRKEMSE
jgi:hypothetical protein